MKIRMTNEYRTYEVYDTVEFNPEDYPELNGLTETEIIGYLNENRFDFKITESSEENLIDTFMFERDIVRDKVFDNDYSVVLVKED